MNTAPRQPRNGKLLAAWARTNECLKREPRWSDETRDAHEDERRIAADIDAFLDIQAEAAGRVRTRMEEEFSSFVAAIRNAEPALRRLLGPENEVSRALAAFDASRNSPPDFQPLTPPPTT